MSGNPSVSGRRQKKSFEVRSIAMWHMPVMASFLQNQLRWAEEVHRLGHENLYTKVLNRSMDMIKKNVLIYSINYPG